MTFVYSDQEEARVMAADLAMLQLVLILMVSIAVLEISNNRILTSKCYKIFLRNRNIRGWLVGWLGFMAYQPL